MMELKNPFPDPREADDTGIVCFGGDISVELLQWAYAKGIFPWPTEEDAPILWFSPGERGILEFADLRVAKSLRKFLQKVNWTYTVNQNFADVIEACARQSRPGQAGTWITGEMIDGYIEFHHAGFADSVEVWNEDKDLIGGIYGVRSENYFSAESMFFTESNASKAAFLHLVEYLRAQGLTWMDVQMLTSVSQSFGCKLISRDEFLKRIGV